MKAIHHIDGDPRNNDLENIKMTEIKTNAATMRKLTPMQVFALVCAEKQAIRENVKSFGWRTFITFLAFDSDITTQVKALRKRRLLQYRRMGVGKRSVVLTEAGVAALAEARARPASAG
jgi:hypothetical protein